MNANGLFNLLGSIVTVALVTTVVAHPGSSGVINALGNAFSGSLKTAMGN